MAGEWVTKKIGELGRVVTGKTPSTADERNFGGGYPFITIPDLDGRTFIDRTARTLSNRGAEAIRGSLLPAGAVMMSCIATIGKCGITARSSFTNQQINSVILNHDFDPRFVYYAFTQLGHALESAGGGGSVYTNVSKSRFSDIQVRAPSDTREQRAIALILGNLDDKIELNQRMSVSLGAMARALFKSWFVDFEPVRAKAEGHDFGLPPHLAALFPDRLVKTEHGEVPAGWRYAPVSEFAQLKGGKQLEKQRFVEDGPVPVFGGAGLMGYTDEHNAEGYVISVGRVGAYCGQFFAHRGKAWINNNASLISQLDGVPGEWLLLSLRNLDMDLIKKGAAQPFVSNSDLAAMPIVAPPVPVLTAFHRLAEPLFRREELVRSEIKALAALRDALLPKLISGELRVKDAETFLDRVL